ncbi:thermonuclease family protein [Rhizobium sp. SSA_523]|uniref:thermonuclease family protein n=1 Tax=Rhizobium sp. SSA_523 TaxID=2952477 RepID=UPI0020914709|nr:thermonuclease family protein [Rhizobium sp. SSA_523]MCO5730073.1 thermonuclease family protein [Rhizobium sp. SSA_523]WKC25139.1 thermonuclease family protein [Rhizobium sp. SSA_523]
MLKLVIAIALTLAPLTARAQGPVTGRASIIDGDTIEIRGQRIRLQGIDAPESWQGCWDASGKMYRCGKVAADALDQFLAASRPTRCDFVEWDRYHRMVGECFRSDGASVGDWMVRSGHALDYTKYSKGAFVKAQREAEAKKAGIWQGRFDPPWEARRQ